MRSGACSVSDIASQAALPAFAVGSAALVVAVAHIAGASVALALAVVCLASTALLRMPVPWWPSAILLATAAAPAHSLPVPGMQGQNGNTSPALLLVIAWAAHEVVLKRLRWTATRRWVAVSAVVLTTALASSTLTAGPSVGSIAWSANVLVFLVVVPLLMTPAGAATVVKSFAASGAVLGVLAVIEVHVLHANVLWGWVGGWDGRAQLGFGHPLYAASFFSVALLVAVHQLVRRPSPGAALIAGACGTGLAAAGSRGALIAALVGILGLALAIVAGRAGSRRQLAPMAVIGALFLVVAAAGLAQRSTAGDSEGSNAVRARSLDTGLYLASLTPPLGGGPGRAYVIKTTTPGPGTDELRSIENAWVELYVAVGPLGCAAFALYFGTFLVIGVRYRRWLGVAATCSLLVGYTFYNALEGGRPLTLVLLGLALSWCLVTPGGPTDQGSRWWRLSPAVRRQRSLVVTGVGSSGMPARALSGDER